jgi:hypothetical protein
MAVEILFLLVLEELTDSCDDVYAVEENILDDVVGIVEDEDAECEGGQQ